MDESGIIIVRMTDNFFLKIDNARKIVSAAMQLANGKKRAVLIELGTNSSEDREVREFFATAGGGYSILDAILVSSPMQKLAAKLYVKLNHPSRTTRIFDFKRSAIEWLLAELPNARLKPDVVSEGLSFKGKLIPLHQGI